MSSSLKGAFVLLSKAGHSSPAQACLLIQVRPPSLMHRTQGGQLHALLAHQETQDSILWLCPVVHGWMTDEGYYGLRGGQAIFPSKRSVLVGEGDKVSRTQVLSRVAILGGPWCGYLGSLQARRLQEGAGHPWTGREFADKDKLAQVCDS